MTRLLEALPTPIPFDRIDPAEIEPSIQRLLAEGRAALDAVAVGPANTFDASFGALEQATDALELAMGVISHLESVKSSDALRQAYNAILPEVSAFWSSISLHAGLYAALRRYAQSPDAATLDPIRSRYVKKTLDDFRRSGAELDDAGKKELEALDRQLSQLTTHFSQNVLDATSAFQLFVSEAQMAGVPESARTSAQEAAQALGRDDYLLTLQAPSVVAVLNHADDRRLREDIWRTFNTRGTQQEGKDNRLLIGEILHLRQQRARLLGFENFADLVAQDRMAQSGAEAARFVEELREKTEPAFEQEKAELLAFRRKLEGPNCPAIEPWDVAYYSEKQRKALYDFDEEQLRPYFSAERVLKGAFDLAQELYGVRVIDADLPVWHPSVRAHRLVDGSGSELGVFYTDLFPRTEKRDGAWMHGLLAGSPGRPHIALFCANAQPPTADRPSLMSFRDVETIFHEFGHLLHHLLSEVPIRSLACTRVAQDFVELPSQIMENWCSEKEALDRFALHFETGERIPDELMAKLLSARNYRAATMQMRQLGFAAADLALHTRYDRDRNGDPNAYANAILDHYSASKVPDDYAMIASFGHLFGHPVGYAAGYYSYKWAEVLDADAFSRFKKEGLYNPKTGMAFRRAVLARGDSAEPMELFEEFMGRRPLPEAMLERQGLLKSA